MPEKIPERSKALLLRATQADHDWRFPAGEASARRELRRLREIASENAGLFDIANTAVEEVRAKLVELSDDIGRAELEAIISRFDSAIKGAIK